MKRTLNRTAVAGGLLLLVLLAACTNQDGPSLGILRVDVTPDTAHVTIMSGPDLVDFGDGDVEVLGLQPGTYEITADDDPNRFTTSVEVRAHQRLTASVEVGEPSRMQLTYQPDSSPAPPSPRQTMALQRYGNSGGGGGGGHNGGGGGNVGGHGGNSGGAKGDVYGDLWKLYRDVSGKPILDANNCVQPISSLSTENNLVLVTMVLSTDGPEAKCEPTPEDLPYVQEVDFGRLNLVRSPPKVLQKAYDAAMATLAASELPITTDPAGRLVATIAGEPKTIDSPLENVALYEHLIRSGMETGTLSLDGVTLPRDPLDIAASLFAGGADKSGTIDLDEVVYINEFLGLNVFEGADDYTHYTDYDYSRESLYDGVMATILVPDPNEPGTYHAQDVNLWTWPDMFDSVPVTGSDARGFALAANDALQVIVFVHDNAVR